MGIYNTIDNYLDKEIKKSDATYNMDNIREGKVSGLETFGANFCGMFGMYVGQGFPTLWGMLATYWTLHSLGANDYISVPGMIAGGVAGSHKKITNLSTKAGAMIGSKTGAFAGKTIDFVLFKDLFGKK